MFHVKQLRSFASKEDENMKRVTIFLTLLLFILSGAACSSLKHEESPVRKYVLQESKGEKDLWILLQEDGTFEIHLGIAISYEPAGTYTVEDHELILRMHNQETFRFQMRQDTLILTRVSSSEGLLFEGMRFIRSKSD